jgi:hypothetical protein
VNACMRSAPAMGPAYINTSTTRLIPAHTYLIPRVRAAVSPYGFAVATDAYALVALSLPS